MGILGARCWKIEHAHLYLIDQALAHLPKAWHRRARSASPGQHMTSRQRGQRGQDRRAVKITTGGTKVWPSQLGGGIEAQQDVQPTPIPIAVDEHCRAPGPSAAHGKHRSNCACAEAAGGAQHPNHHRPASRARGSRHGYGVRRHEANCVCTYPRVGRDRTICGKAQAAGRGVDKARPQNERLGEEMGRPPLGG